MAGRPDSLRPEDVDDERAAELLEAAADDWYGDSAFFGAMAWTPTIFERIVDVFRAFPRSEGIDAELLELMRLKIAEVNGCTYCATVRTLSVRDGIAPTEAAVFGTVDEDALDRRTYLAVRLAERFAEDPHRLTEEQFEALRTEYTAAEVVELLLFAGLEVGLDRFCIALELDTTAESEYPSGLDYPLEDEPRSE
ncbi:carboxymuconolactone decarboxylase family protein [Haloplanus halophilus]|uniref:carboxymuconolactone decarboxylase family protein n=1 Tax=Haloplanus halophilus TaxID=2949993 RepID=UPI00203E4EE6|nr:hypothetical protein [Haloplanus sp. GDY1]